MAERDSRTASEDAEDRDLRYAIALSLQDHRHIERNGTTDSAPASTSDELPRSNAGLGLLSLDRKQMEQERLARIAKRNFSSANDADVYEVPPPKRRHIHPPAPLLADLSVPYPNGVVKRTSVRGYARSDDDIKIEEVLQKESLILALVSSFQWDEPWLLSKIDISRTKLLLAAFASNESQKEEMRRNAPSGVKFCFPPMNGPGSMHSKLQLLKFPRYLRVVFPTGNLVPYDWGETGVMENMLFLIDLPLKECNGGEDTETMFQCNLQQFLRDMGVEDGMIASLSKYDFSRTKNLGLVYSRPGSHMNQSFSQIGYNGLRTTVSSLGLATRDPIQVDIACASLGALKYDLIEAIYNSCKGGENVTMGSQNGPKGLTPCKEKLDEQVRIYFPTQDTVAKSRGGTKAAGTICVQEKWWQSPAFPRKLMRDCVNTREGLLMHSKVIFVHHSQPATETSDRGQAWAYIGSANLSESAWGRVVKDKASGRPKMTCRNWECGVVIPVSRSSESTTPTDMSIFQGKVPIPMQVPSKQYGSNQQPWFYQGV